MAITETTLAEQLKAQGIEDGVEDIAVLLQPLLEQEAQLEYVFLLPLWNLSPLLALSASSLFLHPCLIVNDRTMRERGRGRERERGIQG